MLLEEPPLGLNRSLRLGRSQDDWVGVNAARLFQVVHRNASRFEAFPEQTDVGQKYLIRPHAEMHRREPPQIRLDRPTPGRRGRSYRHIDALKAPARDG